MDPLRIAVIDTETTGLDVFRHEIIEIAVLAPVGCFPRQCSLEFDPDLPELGIWSRKVLPKRLDRADPRALEINGYSEEAWSEAIDLETALIEIAPLWDRIDLTVGHNHWFDLSLVRAAYHHMGIDYQAWWKYRVDTSSLAMLQLFPLGMKTRRLDAVCRILGISNQGAHTASADVVRTRKVYDKLKRPSVLNKLVWKHRICMTGGRG